MSAERFAYQERGSQEPQPFYVFLPGATSTYPGVESLNRALKEAFGPDNVRSYDSVLGGGTPDKNRFKDMGDLIRSKLREGNPLTVIAHSFGASELHQALKHIQKTDPGLLTDNEALQQLSVVLISPSGFTKNAKEALLYAKAFARFSYLEGYAHPKLMDDANFFRGVDSLNIIPLESTPPEALAESLRGLFPERSHYTQELPSLPFEAKKSYDHHLTQEEIETLHSIDAGLRAAFTRKDKETAEELIKQRSRLLTPHIHKTLTGEYTEDITETAIPEYAGWSVGAVVGLANAIVDALSSRPMQRLRELEEKGANILFLLQEYDLLVSLSHLMQFMEGSSFPPQDKIRILELAPHAALVLQPDILASYLKQSQELTKKPQENHSRQKQADTTAGLFSHA